MTLQARIRQHVEALESQAPAGIAVGLHVKFTAPAFFLQTYPAAWTEVYARDGLVMADPVVNWSYSNTGAIRWSELEVQDPMDVLGRGAAHGLRYGLAVGLDSEGTRSIAGLARADREFTDEEAAQVVTELSELHRLTAEAGALTSDARAELKRLAKEIEARTDP